MPVSSPIYRTRLPINFYLIIISSFLTTVLLIEDGLVKSSFYGLTIFFFLYITFGRHACIVILSKADMHIRYAYPWEKNIIIQINSIKNIDYENSFYNFSSDKARGGLHTFPKYCADLLVIKYIDENKPDMHIDINTTIGGFKSLIKKISAAITP